MWHQTKKLDYYEDDKKDEFGVFDNSNASFSIVWEELIETA